MIKMLLEIQLSITSFEKRIKIEIGGKGTDEEYKKNYATLVSSCIKNVRNFSYTRAVFSTNGAWPASAIIA